MHQDAFPGEDISDRPAARGQRARPLRLLDASPPSGRYRAAELSPVRAERASPRLRAARRTLEAPRAARSARAGAATTCACSWRAATVEPVHARFADLPDFLAPGDLLVVNTSATVPAALDVRRPDGTGSSASLDRSCPARQPLGSSSCRPAGTARRPRTTLARARPALPGGGDAHARGRRYPTRGAAVARHARTPDAVPAYLAAHGAADPLRATSGRVAGCRLPERVRAEPGSAEMPSAARPFTAELVTRLVARGRRGRADPAAHRACRRSEAHERPYPERYRVPARHRAARQRTRTPGGRVVAVGTTVVRALETVADERRHRAPGRGLDRRWWSRPTRGVRAVDGLLTGWHEPEAIAPADARGGRGPRRCSSAAYDAALAGGYLWHEFGDSHLLLPRG